MEKRKYFLEENYNNENDLNNKDILWNIVRHNEKVINCIIDKINAKVWKHILSKKEMDGKNNNDINNHSNSIITNTEINWNAIINTLKNTKEGTIISKIFFIFQCLNQFEFVQKYIQKRCPNRNRFLFLIDKIHEVLDILHKDDNAKYDVSSHDKQQSIIERGIFIEKTIVHLCAEYIVEFEDNY